MIRGSKSGASNDFFDDFIRKFNKIPSTIRRCLNELGILYKYTTLTKDEQSLLNFDFLKNILEEKSPVSIKNAFQSSYNLESIDDIDDISFIALCLAAKADGIWSDDTHFKTRKNIIIFRTRELALAFKSR